MRFQTFADAITIVGNQLMTKGEEVDPGHWQGVPTDPSTVTLERRNVNFTVPMPADWSGAELEVEGTPIDSTLDSLRYQIKPNLPWADDHFAERVSRVPSNPGERYKNWPHWNPQAVSVVRADTDHTATYDGQLIAPAMESGFWRFTHTYQERYWPKQAGKVWDPPYEREAPPVTGPNPNRGIRYEYGDLDDLVTLILREPHTRQAYLPIFFPEDTGAVHGGRVPCTLGYQFLLRDGKLHMWYFIRSCDFHRHFRDDLYLSARLLLWVLEECGRRVRQGGREQPEWLDPTPGDFHFVCPSLHINKGDLHHAQSYSKG